MTQLFRLDVSDCTVHVLTSLATAQSKNWVEAKENMITIHYKEDEIWKERTSKL